MDALFTGEALIAVADKADARERGMHRFQAANVLLDIQSNFHLEEAKSPGMPAA